MDMKAPGETVDVLSRCSSSYSTWLEANPIMYNVRLASANQASGQATSAWDLLCLSISACKSTSY